MASKTANLVVSAQDKVTPELKKIQGSIAKFEAGTKKMSEGLRNAGKAMVGFLAFDKTKDLAIDAVKAFAGKEKSLLRFDAVMRQIGSNEQISNLFKKLSDELEGLGTGIDDANVLDLASQFLDMGRTAPEVEKLLRVSADLSALTGNDLASSMEMLTKADSGNVKALKILIPTLKNLTEEQIKNGDAVDLVAEKTRGLAEQIGGGTAGSLQKFSDTWEGMLETVWKQILLDPTVKGLIDFMSNLTKAGAIANNVNEAIVKIQNTTASKNSNEYAGLQLEKLKAMEAYINNAQNGGAYNNTDATFKAVEQVAGSMKNMFQATTNEELQRAKETIQRQITQVSRNYTPPKQTTTPTVVKDDLVRQQVDYYKNAVDKEFQKGDWIFGEDAFYLDEALFDKMLIHANKIAKESKNRGNFKLESTPIDYSSVWDQGIDTAQEFYSTLTGLADSFNQAEIDRMKLRQTEEEAIYEKQLKLKKDFGEDTTQFEQDFADKKEKALQKIAKAERKADYDNAVANKIANSSEVLQKTYVGVMGAWAPPTPFSPVLAGMISALGATQFGAIMATPLPQLYNGGIIPGSQSGSAFVAGERNQDEMILPLRKQKLQELGIGGSGVTLIVQGNIVGLNEEDVALKIGKQIESLKDSGRLKK